jgi:hypothetical protein
MARRVSAEERKKALQKRTQQAYDDRDQKGLGRSGILDYSAASQKIKLYDPKSGRDKNYIDILPFEVVEEWYRNMKTFSGRTTGVEPGYVDYKLEVPVHRSIGPNKDSFLCLREAFGKRCYLCETRFAELDKDEPDEKITDALKVSWRCFYNVYDYDEPEKDIQLWEDFSYHMFEKLMLEDIKLLDTGVATFSSLEEGYSIEFKCKVRKLGKNEFKEAHSFEFYTRESYDESILDQTFPLDRMLIICTNEDMERSYLGLSDDEPVGGDGGQEEEEPRSAPRERQRPPQGRTRGGGQQEQAAPPADEGDPTDHCPKGHVFGTDCNNTDDCGACPEITFEACANAQDQGGDQAAAEPAPETRTRGRAAAPSRGRTRGTTEQTEAPARGDAPKRRQRSFGRSN